MTLILNGKQRHLQLFHSILVLMSNERQFNKSSLFLMLNAKCIMHNEGVRKADILKKGMACHIIILHYALCIQHFLLHIGIIQPFCFQRGGVAMAGVDPVITVQIFQPVQGLQNGCPVAA